jgi:hypothetical protein
MMAAGLAGAADDPLGWSKARWGDTDAELIEAFGGEVVRFAHPDPTIHARVGIESMELADTKFRVYMVLGTNDRLQQVLLLPSRLADGTDALFQSLEELLVQKYGQPWKTNEDTATNIQWTFKSTIITLSRIRIPGSPRLGIRGLQFLHLEYKQNAGNDKL